MIGDVENLRPYLHDLRLGPYIARSGSSLHSAVALYHWNTHLASSFHEVLSFVEVVLRNAVDPQLRSWNTSRSGTENWLSQPADPLSRLIDKQCVRDVHQRAHRARARRSPNHPRKREAVTHFDLLANMTFGQWVRLFPQKHRPEQPVATRTLWDQALCNSFTHLKNDPHGHATRDRLHRLHALRNRVSHMENLLEVDINGRLRDALQLVNSIDPALHDWLRDAERVRSVAVLRPVP